MGSIKSNIIWNSVRTASNLLFPLITFPYVSRVLNPESIGLYNYIYSIASYFSLFAALGFPLYGTREIAKVKEIPEEFGLIVNSIFSANVISSIVSFAAYIVTSIWIAEDNFGIYIVVGLSILMTCISFDWFFQGIEDFHYITIRSLVVKAISLLGLFTFVHDPSDLICYAIVSLLGTCGNNIFNLFYINRYVKLSFCLKNSWHHIKGASIFFLTSIATSLYTNINSVLLGSLGTMEDVGYFTTGNRIISLLLTIITTIIYTIMPRMSYYVGNSKSTEAYLLQKKTLNLINYILFPISVGIFVLAEPAIMLLAGNQFAPSIIVLRLLSPILIAISWGSYIGAQIFIPSGKEKYGNYSVFLGAVINIFLAFILIPQYGYVGVSLSVLITEVIVTIFHLMLMYKVSSLRVKDFFPAPPIVASFIMGVSIYLLNFIFTDSLMSLITVLMGCIIYLSILYLLKDSFIKELFCKIMPHVR